VANGNLTKAKKAKKDEFYTQLEDIEKELRHYDFTDKTIYCNCDNPNLSNFYKYFKLNFHYLKINKLICTGYNPDGNGFYGEYDGKNEIIKQLNSNGDFRSEECIEFLKECDVVVTNPPFSLFREYVAQLMEYGKKFLIIGNTNGITYKEIFPYIKANQLWLGCSSFNSGMYFRVPNDYEYADTYKFDRERNGDKVMRVSSICWYTNIGHSRKNTELDLYKKYSADEYPKYDNYDAIEVSRVENIPMDYEGVMGVPITFLDKYCPTQFEIIGLNRYVEDNPRYGHRFHINGKETYARILIRRKK
jgi:hypothetical protein